MPTDTTLVLTRVFPAPAERIYAAWTNPEMLRQWFCPDSEMIVPVAEVDAQAGGNYRIVMQNKDGGTHSPSGTYEEVVPNKRLVFSWKWADSEVVTRVTIDLNEMSENETEMTLTHEGFPDSDMRDKHNGGWTGCLDSLQRFL